MIDKVSNKMVFRGIKVEFLSEELKDYPTPWYSIVYDDNGFMHQGYYSSNILTVCRYLNTHFQMSENDIFMAFKPVADAINEACNEIEKEKTNENSQT